MWLASKFLETLTSLSFKILGVERGSWAEKKYKTVLVCLISIPIKKIKRLRRTTQVVEMQYDNIAGQYIKENYYLHKMRYAIVNGEVKQISSVDNMREIRLEIRNILSKHNFKNVLEVGVGELTTLSDIHECFGPDIECYGVDLSLNRIRHGLKEFEKRHNKQPHVAKANAMNLPFADNSFDLVITRHTLEQMPSIYKSALQEILRVARKHVFMFEPSYELGGFAQKLKMINNDYVRGIPHFLRAQHNVKFETEFLMMNSANPLNHTACYQVTIENAGEEVSGNQEFVCPITKMKLKKRMDHYHSASAKRAFPVIDGIPVFDPEYSILVTDVT
ncbi:methyltransferase domain-containing protein [Planktomarina temperata]|nr:methyltransferase domain-containing protein [Planktomarina temperata]